MTVRTGRGFGRGRRGNSRLGSSILGSSMLGSSTLGSSIFGRSILGSSTLDRSTLGSSSFGSSTLGSSTLGNSKLARLKPIPSGAGSSSTGSAGYSVRSIVNEYVSSLWWLRGFTSAAGGRVSPSGISSTRTRAEASASGFSSEGAAEERAPESAPVFSANKVCTLCTTGLPKYASVSP